MDSGAKSTGREGGHSAASRLAADTLGGRPILLVDDDSDQLSFVRVLFENAFPTMRVQTASSTLEAIDAVAREAPSVVVSDLNMPGQDGISLLARVQGIDPEILRVLYTGAYDMDLERVASQRCCATVFWKDEDPNLLIQWIRRHLRIPDRPVSGRQG